MSSASLGENNPMFGKKHSKEILAKMINRKHTEEAKTKIRAAHLGKIVSVETRAKMSAAKKGKNHPMFGKAGAGVLAQKISSRS